MSTRKWRDSGLDEHGVSRSVLRDLDTVETALNGVRSVEAATARTADIRRAANLDAQVWRAGADIQRRIGRAGLANMRSAAAGTRAVDALVPKSPVEIANTSIGNSRAALHRANASFRVSGFENFAKAGMFPSTKFPMLEQVSRLSSQFGSLGTLPQSPSLVTSMNKIADRLGYIANSPAAKMVDSLSRVGQTQANIMLNGWQRSFVAKDLASAFTGANTVNRRMLEITRGMDAIIGSLDGSMRRMMSAFDVVGRLNVSGIAEYLGSIDWEALERAARIQEARRPRTRIGFAALEAYDAFYLNRPWDVDRFLTDHLRIKPSHETRQALWQVLREAFERTIPEPATWITLDDEGAIRYLRAAVYNEVRRARRDQEMADRIWWPEGEVEEDEEGRKLSKPALCSENTLDLLMRKAPSPETLFIPSGDPRGQVLQLLYVWGTEPDKKIVGMLIAGYDLPAIADLVGWAEVQRFQRKARRWMKNKL